MILLIDNYDSFTYNLAHLVESCGEDVLVRRNDSLTADEAAELEPSHLVISPGPGRPEDAGETVAIIRRLAPSTPTLGVCLGHQAIVTSFGGTVERAPSLVHGKSSRVHHDGSALFADVPPEFEAGRYHSLVATALPDCLEASAHSDDGEVMAVRHRTLPVLGVQFHPESILTPHGPTLVRNFVARGCC